VGTIDFLPTAAELLGLPLPAAELDGRSLLDLLAGGPPPDRRGIYMESVYPKENFGWAALNAFQSETWKWIDAPDAELYDLAADPGERDNLRLAEPDRSRILTDRLARFRALIPEPPSPGPELMSPEVAERLRSLGYLSGGAALAEEEELPDPKTMIAVHADFEEAKRAMDEGRFRNAIPHFETVLSRNPQNGTARLGLGTALVRVARFAEADAVLTRAIEVHPGNTTIQASLADALFGQREFAEALEIYRLAERDPSLGTRHVPSRIVLCLERTGRPGEADTALRLYRERPADAEFWDDLRTRIERDRDLSARIPPGADPRAFGDEDRITRALTSAGLGIIAEPFRWLQDPMEDGRLERRRLELLTQLYFETRQTERSIESLTALARQGPLAPQQEKLRADLLLDLGSADAALVAYQNLPESVPTAERQLGLARCEAARGNPQAALRAIRAALGAGWSDGESLFVDPAFRPLRSYAPFADLADSLTARSGL
jgi:Flp pilus assembly protein TadD